MDVHFYLNNQEVNVETGLTFTETLDESLDGGTVTLAYNNNKNAIAPMTPFQIKDLDTNETLNFVVVLDAVEKVSKTQEIYSHTLTVTQNTHKLTKHILRNSQFYNPHKPVVNTACNFVGALAAYIISAQSGGTAVSIFRDELQLPYSNLQKTERPYESVKVNLPNRARVSRAYIEVSTSISSAQECYFESLLENRIQSIPQDSWSKNYHKKLYVYVKRYESGSLTTEQLIEVGEGQTIVELSDLSIFEDATATTTFNVEISDKSNEKSTFKQPDNFGNTRYYPAVNSKSVLSILAMLNINLKIEIYYYTLYDVLETINKQAKKSHRRIGEATYRDSVSDIYTMPSKESEQGQLLDSIIAPDFSFTQKDIYSCVNDVFAYIDAIATLDKDNVLGFEYFNDLSKNTVQNVDFNKSDIQVIHNDEYYVNKIQTQYQDGRQENGYYYPGRNSYRRIGTKSYGILKPEDYIFTLPYPIDFIDKVLIENDDSGISFEGTEIFDGINTGENYIIFAIGGVTRDIYLPREMLDITPAVVEQAIYQQLELEESTSHNTQLNTLYYIQGQNYIQVGGTVTNKSGVEVEVWKNVVENAIRYSLGEKVSQFFNVYINFGELRNLKYQVKYHAKFDGKVDVESTANKTVGETYTAQGNSGVQISRMGVNMLGLLARVGNTQKVVSLPIGSFDSRIKKGMIWIDEDGNKFIANKVKTTIMSSPERCITEVEFSKDFNMLSQFIQIDKQKRFYEISENITSTGYETLTEYLYFDFETLTSYMQNTCISNRITGGLLMRTFNSSNIEFNIEFAEFSSYEYENDTQVATQWIYAPVHIYGCGNCVCFEIGYDSPLNAGDKVAERDSAIQGEATLYTAESGIAEIVRLKLAGLDETKTFTNDFPTIPNDDGITVATDIEMKYYKKPNEIFHLNYEIALLPKDNKEIYFGENLITKNALIHDYDVIERQFKLYVSNSELYSIIDKKALGQPVDDALITVSQTTSAGAVYGQIVANKTVTCKSWCIADQYGNIYIAANQELNNAFPRLHFATRNDRIL